MKIMLETTVWPDATPNHVYLFNDSLSHASAYVRAGTKTVFKFKKPMSIDRRGRTFVELEDTAPKAPDPEVIEVKGSKGAVYFLSDPGEGWVCTCPGFTFRGSCKHLDLVAEKT